MTQHTASCLCGDVRIVASGDPYRIGLCHCLDCRKHHGALFFAAAIPGCDDAHGDRPRKNPPRLRPSARTPLLT